MTNRVFLTGTDIAENPKQLLKAGALAATLDNGSLRWILWNGTEVLRGIMFLVRTPGWGTPAAQISNLDISENTQGFSVRYDAFYGADQVGVRVRISLEGHSNGNLTANAIIQANAPFETNRTGFVILHPLAGVVGTELDVEHDDGSSRKLTMPVQISPGQPIMDIRALTHRPRRGVSVTTRFEGDIFEMEDHRNWSDASFKTYNRPIGLPYPYVLDADTAVFQTIEVSILDDGSDEVAFEAVNIPQISGQKLPVYALPLDSLQAVEDALPYGSVLADVAPARLLLRYDFTKENDSAGFGSLASLLRATGTSLELQVIVASGDGDGADAELASLAQRLLAVGINISEISAFAKIDEQSFQPGEVRPTHPSEANLLSSLSRHFPNVRHGSGTPAFFTEFNRKRPDQDLADYFSFATTPSVHAADDASVLETLKALPHILNSARVLAGNKSIVVGPAGIGARINPYGPSLNDNISSLREGMAAQDPRQRGLFAAAWHVGYLAQLAPWSIERFAFGAPVGPFGLVSTQQPYARSFWDDVPDGSLYPLYHVAKWISQAGGGTLTAASIEDDVAKIEWTADGKRRGLLANLTQHPKHISLNGWVLPKGQLLDAKTLERAAENDHAFTAAWSFPQDVTLNSYAVIHIDGE